MLLDMAVLLVLGSLESLMSPSLLQLQKMVVQSNVLPEMFKSTYEAIIKGNPMWNQLSVPATTLYPWDPRSTCIHKPPFFNNMTKTPSGFCPHDVKDAYCLLHLGDRITTDHISAAGSIHKDSPAAKYLVSSRAWCKSQGLQFIWQPPWQR